jgi:iron-sulfur cluster assembly protein
MSATEFPIVISPEAADQLRKIVARKAEPGSFIRIGVKGGGCSGLEYVLKLDSNRLPHDLNIELESIEVVCDAKSAIYLQGSTLVYTGNLIGGGFSFENPNAKRSCGCGTSFTPIERTA